MAGKRTKKTVAEDSRYHDTWRLLKKYRDVVWSMELSVQQLMSAPVIKCKKTPRKKCRFVAERRKKR